MLSRHPLALDTVRKIAPSVFAVEKHESRSDRYTYIPTSAVLEGLLSEGWNVHGVSQGRSRIPGKAEFTKHMLRLRRTAETIKVGDSFPEVVLINSHDGTSAYQLKAGVFRLICLNGMVLGDAWTDVRVPHKGNIVHNVIEGTYRVVDQFQAIADNVETMRGITLDRDEAQVFAETALGLRWDDPEKPAPVKAGQVLAARRVDDNGPDLWRTFNRIQENLIKGGLTGRSVNQETGRVRRAATREVAGIDSNTKLNQALWTLTEKMAELKGRKLAA